MRDINKVILAEDDRDISFPLRSILEGSGYHVQIVDSVADLLKLAEISTAKWLILDLELRDGLSDEIIPLLKNKYNDLFIIVVTGYWETYREHGILRRGANLMFRKPYYPEDLLEQLKIVRSDLDGIKTKKATRLAKDGMTLEITTGKISTNSHEIILPEFSRKLIALLSVRQIHLRSEWKQVSTSELIRGIYDLYDDDPVEIETYQNNIRVLVHRTRKFIGDDGFIVSKRGPNNVAYYQLDDSINYIEQ